MSGLRIHELAKELSRTNREVLEFLKSKDIEVKSHMSILEEGQEKLVRGGLGEAAAQNKEAEKKEKSVEENVEKKPKKKNIIQVYRPQNAMTQEGKNFRRPGQGRPGAGKGAQGRPAGERPARPEGARPARTGERPTGDRPVRAEGSRPARPEETRQEQVQAQSRPAGDRPARSDRPAGDRPARGQERFGGDRPARNSGDRPVRGDRPAGDRPARSGGDRPARNAGDRPFRSNSGDGRRPFQKRDGENRGAASGEGRRPFGERGDSRPGQNRDRRNDGRKPAGETMDLGMRKPGRDARKDKDREKEKGREEKMTGDRRPNAGGNRPNQGRRPNQRLPKALQKPVRQQPKEEKKEEIKEIKLPEKMTVRELADKMKIQPSVIVKKLFMEGILVTVNHEIEFEKAQEIALEYNIIAEPEEKIDVIEELLREEEEDEATLVSRPPVVCVMGHVDHGKTSLLDKIRNSHVTDREAGGITQHIGAYVVNVGGRKITFLDTPGHEAFTAMRMRGANATDIAVLVVAADDGVMPQTVEAINHAKAAGVEIIVAINKIDKPSANVERVKQELSEHELIPEDWGGSTVFVPVSAKSGEGIDDLLEMILLTSEVLELKANPKRKARGLVIEAQLDKGKGPVATILVQKGTLRVGDYIAAGASSGKVRAMMDDKGRRVKEAGPSTPVEILGLSDVPGAGEVLVATESDKEAKNFAATFVSEGKNRLLEETKAKMSLDDLYAQIQEGNLKELGIVVKADVQGSVEAVKQSLLKLSNDEVVVKIIHGGVGAINESDVTLASASNAIIIGFNVRPDATAKAIAEQEGVDVRLYRVIYQAIEDVEAAMKGMLDPIFEEKVIGHAEVRQIFKASGVGNIAGSYVLDGVFQRNCKVRISREGKQIFEGGLASLKRFKDDVKEVKAGYECGLVFEDFGDIQELDQVEAYIMVEVPR
ncbi:MAG TPA: translation initiation factor IF-2 [Candidatus Egerieimonas intestinavium]|uniref:Translation initiation factor IF-2 n=1 Tax=Candidatus Egerieimonas intestinavium TaxID=2840777 RepID=A0A9D1JG70_9FIRM|nr:translation initiation factor IF-2 [Candidatus Egerieimonas intestinavium]